MPVPPQIIIAVPPVIVLAQPNPPPTAYSPTHALKCYDPLFARGASGQMMANFIDVEPTLDNYWRSIILFGRNVASYKFALAKSLIGFSGIGKNQISYEELAKPFADNIVEHLKISYKQGTSGSSKFLEACRRFKDDEITKSELYSLTEKLGFNNVIDAFHIVNNAPLAIKFFPRNLPARA